MAQGSKHKDVRMLQRYHKESVSSLLAPRLAIGNASSGVLNIHDGDDFVATKRKRQRIILSDSDSDGDKDVIETFGVNKSGDVNINATSSSSRSHKGVNNYYFNFGK